MKDRYVDYQRGEVRRTDQGGDHRGNDVSSDRCGDRSERCSDDDRDSQIHNISAENEVPETLEH